MNGRGVYHIRVGGLAVHGAVTEAFLAALEPAALQACLAAAEQLESQHDAALGQFRREVERARYAATKPSAVTERSTPRTASSPVASKPTWEAALQGLAGAEAELTRREAVRPKALSGPERAAVLALGDDLGRVWDAPTTTDRDRKALLHSLLEEVNITVQRRRRRGQPK